MAGPSGPTPLPTSAAPAPAPTFAPGPYAYGGAPPAPPPRRRSKLLIIAVIVVAILLVVGAAAFLLVPAAPAIQVAEINIWAPDNVCGLNTNGIGFDGYNSSTSSVESFELPMPNFNTTTCTVHGVTTNTTGFTLSAIEVPLTIPGNETVSMELTITAPSSSFNGYLNLVLD